MYSLVVLLSILASASFALAFVRGRALARRVARRLARRCCSTRTRGGCSWPPRWGSRGSCCGGAGSSAARDGAPARGRAGAALRAVAAERRLPGRAHRRAVGGAAVAAGCCSAFPGGLFGYLALPLLVAAVFFALRRRPPVDRAVRVLAAIAVMTVGAGVAVLADPARLGDALPRGRDGPGAARARLGRLARRALDGARAGRRRGRVADERPAADQEQRADGLDRRRAADPPRRPRRRHPARAGARRCIAICPRASSTGRRWGSSPTRARPTGATASRGCARGRPRRELLPAVARLDRGRRVLIVDPAAGRAAVAGAVGAGGAGPDARVAGGARRRPGGCGGWAASRPSRCPRTP